MCLVKEKKSLLKKFENTGYYTKWNGLFSVRLHKYVTVVHQFQEKKEMTGEENTCSQQDVHLPVPGTNTILHTKPMCLRVLKQRDYVVPSTHRLMKWCVAAREQDEGAGSRRESGVRVEAEPGVMWLPALQTEGADRSQGIWVACGS